jgi:uncharacterized repeat protein (TIGR04138 family)
MHHPKIEDLIRRDPRYPLEAYEFVFSALSHTQRMLGRRPALEQGQEEEHHVSGKQLLEGARDLALREFGLMARVVFAFWGVNRTDDFGEIVFNLISAGLMSKTERDDLSDFKDVYDLDEALANYRIELPQEAEEA